MRKFPRIIPKLPSIPGLISFLFRSKSKRILVLGGTGFLGEKVIDELIYFGYKPLLLARSKDEIKESWIKKVDVIYRDVNNLSKLKNKFSKYNITSVIYMIGLIRQSRSTRFIDFHYHWVQDLIEICQVNRIRRFLLVSANGAKQNGTEYQVSKWLGEESLKKSGLDWTIFRPSIIFDDSSKYNFINILRSLVKLPVVPIFGDGDYKIAPVYREDVAEIIVKSINHKPAINKTYELCGPEVLDYKSLILKIAGYEGRKVNLIKTPVSPMNWLTAVLGKFKFFPITKDQLTMLLEGNVCADDSAWKEMGITRKSMDSVFVGS